MIIIGLGNPGTQYKDTKHNMGYWILDKLANQYGIEFKLGKHEYMYATGNQMTLLKPLTFMNNSGLAIRDYIDYFNLQNKNILVIYDDVDLPLGQIRFKSQGSSGGQKGLESIIYHLKTDNFFRLKVGIRTDQTIHQLTSYVLSPFHEESHDLVQEVLIHCCDAVEFLLENNINEAMNQYNQKNKENH